MNSFSFAKRRHSLQTLLSLINPVSGKNFAGAIIVSLILGGCANYGTPKNVDIPDPRVADSYSLHDWQEGHSDRELSFILTFSGGGTRASALAYGVMQELRDTNIKSGSHTVRLLDEVDYISSVSGGSFTSAYYGLHGDDIFKNFENDFLRFNLEKHLLIRALNPFLLLTKEDRTESAIKYYQKFLFHDATFAEMIRPDRPMIIINSSDLAYGIRFSFIQEYFDLLCSELSSFPVADAVAASSAVPGLFNPIVVKNYDSCENKNLIGTTALHEAEDAYRGENLPLIISQLETYGKKDKRKFVHFVDGGITDNLGLRAVSDILSINQASDKLSQTGKNPPKHVVVVMVDATTERTSEMDLSNKQPSAMGVIGAVTNLQLTRYDYDSKILVKEKLEQRAAELSTPEHPVRTHLISVSIQHVQQADTLAYLNNIPTSFTLDDKQVDTLIATGRKLLRESPEFQKLLTDLNNR